MLPKSVRAVIGRELAAACQTVPLSQAWSLRDNNIRFKSHRAVDWMHFFLCTGEVLLAGRLPKEYFNMLADLSKAARLLLCPGGISASRLHKADVHLHASRPRSTTTCIAAKR